MKLLRIRAGLWLRFFNVALFRLYGIFMIEIVMKG